MFRNAYTRIGIKFVYGGVSFAVFGRELIGVKTLVQQRVLFCKRAAGMFYKTLIAAGQF